MTAKHPNRFRQQLSAFAQILQKKSGDQHIEPEDESAPAPHRPHRVNREDMYKLMPEGSPENEPSVEPPGEAEQLPGATAAGAAKPEKPRG